METWGESDHRVSGLGWEGVVGGGSLVGGGGELCQGGLMCVLR